MLKSQSVGKVKLVLVIAMLMSLLVGMSATAATDIENTYNGSGGLAVSSAVYAAVGQSYTDYKIYYPTNLNAGPYPLIVWANGSGETYDSPGYDAVFTKLASWGFIVVCNNDGGDADGSNAVESANDMLAYNSNSSSIFFNKIDVNKIGIGGHSQGGAAAINAVTKYPGSNIFKTLFTASTPQQSIASGLEGWAYDPSQINIPYFAIAGTGLVDSLIITPLASMQQNYNQMQSGIPAVMARLKNFDHGNTVQNAHGYLNAWFLYTLKGNNAAGAAFKGTTPEISTNTGRWQDVYTKNMP